MNNPFHAWLLRQRRYCEHEGCLMTMNRATKVVHRNGKDFVFCDWHSKGQIERGLRTRAQLERHSR